MMCMLARIVYFIAKRAGVTDKEIADAEDAE